MPNETGWGREYAGRSRRTYIKALGLVSQRVVELKS
jgi:adenosyl cobinamide kinase/adenosyl cobinamide phosphate guanylyltransferase